ncbi:MAG: transketolase family protein [bacterium]
MPEIPDDYNVLDYIERDELPPFELTRLAYAEKLLEIGAENKNLVVMDADLSKSTMSDRFQAKFPDRFFDMGIAEQDMLGTAAGLAIEGKIPWVSTYAVFVTGRAWDQIRNTICYANLNVKIAASHGGISVGPDGPTHQCIEDIGIMRVIPNMTILVPADYHEAGKAIRMACEINGPVIVRLNREKVPIVTAPNDPFIFGKANITYDGSDVTIVTTGLMNYYSLKAKVALEREGISVRVVNVQTIKPFDVETIVKCAEETGAIVSVEEHNVYCGLGEAVASAVVQNYPVPMKMVGVQDVFGESGPWDELLEKWNLNDKEIVKAVKAVLKMKK